MRMIAHARRRLRSQDGDSLTELLVAMVLGLIIIFASLSMLDGSSRLAARTQAHVDATRRGRLAMEEITRVLRSQLCLGPGTPPISQGLNSSVMFYANLGTVDAPPHRFTLRLTAGSWWLDEYVGTGTPPSLVWPSTPASSKLLLTGVTPTSGVPVLRYWAFGSTQPIQPDLLLPTPVSAADAARTVQISVAFVVSPDPRLGQPQSNVTLRDAVYVRTATPTDPSHGPQCG